MSGRRSPWNTPLIATKCSPPPVSTLLHRPRVVEALRAAGAHPVTVLTAPPGSGKTCAVQDWVATGTAQHPVCWLTLDEEDNHPAILFRYLRRALEPVVGPAGPAPDWAGDWTAYQGVAALVETLGVHARRATLVLDNLEELDDPATVELLSLLLRHQPPTLRLVLATGSRCVLESLGLWSKVDAVEVGARDLAFDDEECAQLTERIMGLDLPPEAVRRLVACTAGWATGIALIAPELRACATEAEAERAFRGLEDGGWQVAQYMEARVLSRLAPEHADFLVRTSILEELTAQRCAEVLGEPRASDLLPALAAHNLFTAPVDASHTTFVTHPLLQAVARRRLEAVLSEREVLRLHAGAARSYQRAGVLDKAVQHAIDAGDRDTAAHLLDADGWAPGDGLERALLAWARHACPEEVARRPQLALRCAAAALSVGDVEVVTDLIAALEDVTDTSGPTAEIGGPLAAIKAAIACLDDRDGTALSHARRLLEAHPSSRYEELLEYYIALSSRLPEGACAVDVAAHARRSLERGDVETYLHWQAMGALRHETAGHLFRAADVYEEALRFADQHDLMAMPVVTALLLGLSGIHRQWGDMEEVRRLVLRARSQFLDTEPGDLCWLHSARGCIVLARNAAALGWEEAAEDFLLLAEHRARRSWSFASLQDEIQDARAVLWVGRDDHAELRSAAKRRLARSRAHADTPAGAYLLAQAYLVDGRPTTCIEVLDPLVGEARRLGTWNERALRALALRAVARRQEGQEAEAHADAMEALERAEAEDHLQVFGEVHPALAHLLHACRTALVERAPADRPAGPSLSWVNRVVQRVSRRTTQEMMERHRGEAEILDGGLAALTPREREILDLLVAGVPPRRITQRLCISLNTVKTHQRKVYEKMGVHSLDELIDSRTRPGLRVVQGG